MNKVYLTGNLTKDPEIRYTQSGTAMATTGIAVNQGYGEKQTTDFFNLQAWDKTAEFMGKFFNKGSRVVIEGHLHNYSYEDKNKVKRSGVDIVVDNIEFAGGKRETAPKEKADDDFDGSRIDDDNIPF